MKFTIDTKAKTISIHGSFTYEELKELMDDTVGKGYTFSIEPTIVKEKEYVPYYPYSRPYTYPKDWQQPIITYSSSAGNCTPTVNSGQIRLGLDN